MRIEGQFWWFQGIHYLPFRGPGGKEGQLYIPIQEINYLPPLGGQGVKGGIGCLLLCDQGHLNAGLYTMIDHGEDPLFYFKNIQAHQGVMAPADRKDGV